MDGAYGDDIQHIQSLINVGKAYLATHDGTIVDRYSYGYILTSLLPPSGIFRCSCRWPNDDDAPTHASPFTLPDRMISRRNQR